MKSGASPPLVDVHAGRRAVVEKAAEDPGDLDGGVAALAAFVMPQAPWPLPVLIGRPRVSPQKRPRNRGFYGNACP